jgi:signal transduction histidine kinase/CheY-like chemotaxis protein
MVHAGGFPDLAAFRSLTFKVVLVMSALASVNGAVGVTSTSYTESFGAAVRIMMAAWACAHVVLYVLERRWPQPVYFVFLSAALVVVAITFANLEFDPTERTGVQLAYFAALITGSLLWLPFRGFLLFSALAVAFQAVYSWATLRGEPVQVLVGMLVPLALYWLPTVAASYFLDRHLRGMREARDELARHGERLAEEVRERTKTIELQQRQLMRAEKMRALGTLAGGIAHDFNNLLTAMLGHSSVIKRFASGDGQVRQSAEAIESAARRAAELTGQILGFARGGKLRDAPVDIHQLISEVIRLLSRSIDKRIEMALRSGAGEAYVMGDPGQLQQVVLNLAVNARDAMPLGGRIVFETGVTELDEARARGLDVPAGKHVALTVSDTGTGMPEEVRARVFEPFFTTKPEGAGTGMGLAMTYGIVRNHGGALEVESAPGRGSTFTVYLPWTDRRPELARDSVDEGAIAGGGRILVVDDEPAVRGVLVRMLESIGCDCVTANNGLEGVEVYRQQKELLDLAIIDMSMPVMNGRDCFRALKGLDPGVKALLSTGHAIDRSAQELLEEGMLGLVRKPYSLQDLSVTLSRALGHDKPEKERGGPEDPAS